MRKRYLLPLAAKEQDELTERYRSGGDAAAAQRCHAVLLSSEEHAVPAIAGLLRTHQATPTNAPNVDPTTWELIL